MFPFDADCSYCRNLQPYDEKNGKFYCEKKHEYVSARARICSMAAEVMGRPNCDKEALRRISKEHGYYVVTAITEILGLSEDNEYMETFKYLRDVILPRREEYQSFIDDYEIDAPCLAELLRCDDERNNYAEYLDKNKEGPTKRYLFTAAISLFVLISGANPAVPAIALLIELMVILVLCLLNVKSSVNFSNTIKLIKMVNGND